MATRGRIASQEAASTSRREPVPPPQIPPFLIKTYDMVDDPSTNHMVAWSPSGQSFTVWDPMDFAKDQLPLHFKHNNYSSFVRQLNTYGFRKVDPDKSEFANEYFIRGRKDLLREIHRRKGTHPSQGQGTAQISPVSGHPAVEVGQYGVTDEILGLKRDKNILMLELLRQRQQQKASDAEMRKLGQRLEETDARQRQMMTFLAKAVQNPAFLQQILASRQQNLQRIDSSDMKGRKKRRTPASKDVLSSQDILGANGLATDALGAETDSAEEDNAEHQPSTANALIQYTPPQEADFSKQFLQMLARDAPTAGPFDPAQQSDWQRHGMGDMGAAFDSLNISHRPGPTTQPSVTIREHLPNSSPAGSGDNGAYLPSTDSFGADLDLMDGGDQPQSAAAAALQQPQQMQAATSLQQLQARQKQQLLQQPQQQKQRSPRHYRAPQPRPANSTTQPFIKPDPEPIPSPYLTSTQPPPSSTHMVLSNGNPSPLQTGFQPSPQSFPMDDLNMIPDVSLPLDVLGSATSADLAMPDEDSLGNDSFWQQFLSDGPANSGGLPDTSGLDGPASSGVMQGSSGLDGPANSGGMQDARGLDEPGGASAAPQSGDAAAAGGGAQPSGQGKISGMGTHSQKQQQPVGANSDGGLQNGGRPPSQFVHAGVSSGQANGQNHQQQQQQQQQQQAKRTSSLDAIKQLQEQLNRQNSSLPASFT